MGEQSFGKGVVQHYFPFEDGSGLKVRNRSQHETQEYKAMLKSAAA